MKLLVLGAAGMLGHKLMQILANRFETTGTVRKGKDSYKDHPILGTMDLLGGVQAENFDSVIEAVVRSRPDVVVNCIGIIKQHPDASDPLKSIPINSIFPHRLALFCRAANARMIHISTDCVFSGIKGDYSEYDFPDATDLYGRSKLLGEVTTPGSLTLRTSMIGQELAERRGLVEWFVSQKGGSVLGFAEAIYSGFTTIALSEIISDLILNHADLDGLWHVSSDPISKYDLLEIINRYMQLNIEIKRDTTVHCNRSLDSTRFRKAVCFRPPSWNDMIEDLTRDAANYERLI